MEGDTGLAITDLPVVGRDERPDRSKLADILGPGLITGASDDDPSGIATYAQAGAAFGFALSWTLLTYPLMCAIQMISAEIGRVTGKGIAANMRRYYSTFLLYALVGLLVLANVISIGADLGAMGAALQLILPGPKWLYVPAFASLIVLLEVFIAMRAMSPRCAAHALAVALMSRPCSSLACRGERSPTISSFACRMDGGLFTMVVAILGTPISPYLFFWQASEEVEDVKEELGCRAHPRSAGSSAPRA